jgi:hypothetical protein
VFTANNASKHCCNWHAGELILPYIQTQLRVLVDKELNALIEQLDYIVTKSDFANETAHETLAKTVTYIIFKIAKEFYADKNWYLKGDVDKICDAVKDEFKRRFVRAHEAQALVKNGDV